jgi:Na+/H+ antiporter NhaD/arsenite permease-like protein
LTEIDTFNVSIILVIFVVTYGGIIHTRIDKTLAAVMGAIIAVIVLIELKVPDHKNPIEGSTITEEGLLEFYLPQDLRIIGLIFGTLVLVEVSQESGVFHFISVKILKMSKGDPKKLLRYFGGLTIVLSALVNNISAMMIVGSLTLIACERLELNPKPYIITELSMTSVGGIITLISSVPNIILADIFDIQFIDFFIIGAFWGLVCMIANFMVFEYLYRNEIPKLTDPEKMAARVDEFDEWSAISDKGLFYRSILVLSLTILCFAFSQQIGLSLATIAITGGIVIVLISGKTLDEVMAKLDWGLIAFFLGLFVLIAALDAVELLDFIAEWLAVVLPENSLLAAIAFGPILLKVATADNAKLFAWSSIFGANFGGGLTPIGAPSAVIGLALLYRKTGEKIGWGEFIKTQGIATIVRLTLTTGYLWILSIYL